jgi:hypothetical protein
MSNLEAVANKARPESGCKRNSTGNQVTTCIVASNIGLAAGADKINIANDVIPFKRQRTTTSSSGSTPGIEVPDVFGDASEAHVDQLS